MAMITLHKGDIVKLSKLGRQSHVGPRDKESHATVMREPQSREFVTIRWAGQKSQARYARVFLTLVRR